MDPQDTSSSPELPSLPTELWLIVFTHLTIRDLYLGVKPLSHFFNNLVTGHLSSLHRHKLPLPIWARIFGHISESIYDFESVELVSRSFNALVANPPTPKLQRILFSSAAGTVPTVFATAIQSPERRLHPKVVWALDRAFLCSDPDHYFASPQSRMSIKEGRLDAYYPPTSQVIVSVKGMVSLTITSSTPGKAISANDLLLGFQRLFRRPLQQEELQDLITETIDWSYPLRDDHDTWAFRTTVVNEETDDDEDHDEEELQERVVEIQPGSTLIDLAELDNCQFDWRVSMMSWVHENGVLELILPLEMHLNCPEQEDCGRLFGSKPVEWKRSYGYSTDEQHMLAEEEIGAELDGYTSMEEEEEDVDYSDGDYEEGYGYEDGVEDDKFSDEQEEEIYGYNDEGEEEHREGEYEDGEEEEDCGVQASEIDESESEDEDEDDYPDGDDYTWRY